MSEAEVQEKRVIQAIVPQRVGLAEALKRHHVVTIQGIAQNTEDFLDPAFWSLVAKDFTVGDSVEIRDDAMTYWGEYLVLSCEPTWAKLHKLRESKLGAPGQKAKPTIDFEIEFKGPHNKYCVIRTSDREVVQQRLATQEAAENWLRDYRKAMKRAA